MTTSEKIGAAVVHTIEFFNPNAARAIATYLLENRMRKAAAKGIKNLSAEQLKQIVDHFIKPQAA